MRAQFIARLVWVLMNVNRAEDLRSHGVERTDCVKDCRNILRVAQDVTGGICILGRSAFGTAPTYFVSWERNLLRDY